MHWHQCRQYSFLCYNLAGGRSHLFPCPWVSPNHCYGSLQPVILLVQDHLDPWGWIRPRKRDRMQSTLAGRILPPPRPDLPIPILPHTITLFPSPFQIFFLDLPVLADTAVSTDANGDKNCPCQKCFWKLCHRKVLYNKFATVVEGVCSLLALKLDRIGPWELQNGSIWWSSSKIFRKKGKVSQRTGSSCGPKTLHMSIFHKVVQN